MKARYLMLAICLIAPGLIAPGLIAPARAASLRVALMARGAAADCDIDIPGYSPPIIPLSGTAPPIVSELDYDQDQGRFAATLTVTGDGMDPIATRVTGAVADVVELPVPVMRLPANSTPAPHHVGMAR